MGSELGRAVWKKHGTMEVMRFDLKPGSRSLETLNAYLASKGKPPIAVDADKAAAAREARKALVAKRKAEERPAPAPKPATTPPPATAPAPSPVESPPSMRAGAKLAAERAGMTPGELHDEAARLVQLRGETGVLSYWNALQDAAVRRISRSDSQDKGATMADVIRAMAGSRPNAGTGVANG